MTVDQLEVVDAVGVEIATGAAVLTIFDHLDWEDPPEHLFILQEKINTYLAFIEGGEVIEALPDAEGRALIIDVVFMAEPPREAVEFVERVRVALAAESIEVRWRLYQEPPVH